jgi:hypothetical protein
MNSEKMFVFFNKQIFITVNMRFFHSNNIININNNDPNPKNKWKIIFGKIGLQEYAHKVAHNIIKENKIPTVEDINSILYFHKIKITTTEFMELLNIPKIKINTKDSKKMKEEIKSLLGLQSSKVQIAGVYIFTHNETGSKYIGSSSQLAIRLNNYIKKKDKPSGLFRPLLYKEGISNFSLEIIPIFNNWGYRAELVLEQYYLLDPSFNLNVIKVANNPSGSNSKSLYMYNRNKTILYYSSIQQKDFINNLNIHIETIKKHLKNGTYYLGKYSFNRELIITAKNSNISIFNLALRLQNERIKFNKNKPVFSNSNVILLICAKDYNDRKIFYGIRPCIKFLRFNKGFPCTKETLIKYIEKGKPYHGYLCKFL